MRIIFIFIAVCLFSSCSKGESESDKEYFIGEVQNSVKAGGKEKVRPVMVKLESGKIVTVFIEKGHSINSGLKVKVFKYKDHKVYYLVK